MIKIFVILASLFLSISLKGQVSYSTKIPADKLQVFKKLEHSLKNIPFNLPNNLPDTFKLSKMDSVAYSNIFREFFDTTQIKSKLVKGVDSAINEVEQINWLKITTINAVFGIHKLLHCIPDSLLFVMPVTEYDSITKELDITSRDPFYDLAVAGYKSGNFRYPILYFRFSSDKKHFVYINFHINFDGFSKEKEDRFNTYLEPVLAPCSGRLSEKAERL